MKDLSLMKVSQNLLIWPFREHSLPDSLGGCYKHRSKDQKSRQIKPDISLHISHLTKSWFILTEINSMYLLTYIFHITLNRVNTEETVLESIKPTLIFLKA